MQIEIKPDDIDKHVKEAILNSTIGKIIQDRLAERLKTDLTSYYNNPIDDVIRVVLRQEITNLIKSSENYLLIEGAIKKILTSEKMVNLTNKVVDKILDDI